MEEINYKKHIKMKIGRVCCEGKFQRDGVEYNVGKKQEDKERGGGIFHYVVGNNNFLVQF